MTLISVIPTVIFLASCSNIWTTALIARNGLFGFDRQRNSPLSQNVLYNSVKISTGRQVFMVTDNTKFSEQSSERKGSDHFSVLTSKTRDRGLLNDAIINLMKDELFLKKSNSLSLVTEALKNCKVPSHLMFYIWKEMFYLGVTVKKQNVKDLLFYCHKFGKRDSVTLQMALDLISSLNKSKYWSSAIFNLIIQLYTEKLDAIYNKRNAVQVGISLSDIVKDLISTNASTLIDEKSIVMLMKYFSNIGDYQTLKLAFSYRNDVIKRQLIKVGKIDKKNGEKNENNGDIIIENSKENNGEINGENNEGSKVLSEVRNNSVTSGDNNVNNNNNNEINENAIIWNAYLSAILKFASIKDTNENNAEYIQEMNDVLNNMVNLKIADFYTLNIMLTYYSVVITDNSKNNNDIKNIDIIDKCMELWNNEHISLLRENDMRSSVEGASRGVIIAYSVMVRCLLLSSKIKKESTTSTTSTTTTTNSNNNNINSNNINRNKKVIDNKYIHEAFRLAVELPMDDVITSSFLFTIGLSQENMGTALECMRILNEKKDKGLKVNNNDNNNDINNINDNTNNVNVNVNDEKSFDYSLINHLDSLLSGYYDSGRYDLAVQAYLISYKNIPELGRNPSNQVQNMIPSNYNKKGNTKTFNIYLASAKELIKDGIITEIRDNNNDNNNEMSVKNKVKNVIYYDSRSVWEFTKKILKERMYYEKELISQEMKVSNNMKFENFQFLLDSYSVSTAIDCGNMIYDSKLSYDLYYYQYTILSYFSCVPTQRVVQSFLRSFQSPSQLFELDKFTKNILLPSPLYKSQFSGNSENRNSDQIRTSDEIINAFLRCGNLPIALEIASMSTFNGFSDSALRNLLIYFDRYWRDYESETIYIQDLLRGQERIERNHNKQMNMFLESNLQPTKDMIEKDYYSMEAEEFVSKPAVYASLQDVTGRCLSVEATILSGILALKTQETSPSFVLWSVLVGVLVSRGDWDCAVDILNNMENVNSDAGGKRLITTTATRNNNNDNRSSYQNNNYRGTNIQGKKPVASNNRYKGGEISQTVELAVLYSLDGGLPLLTKTSPKALLAMNLKRLLPKDNEVNNNDNISQAQSITMNIEKDNSNTNNNINIEINNINSNIQNKIKIKSPNNLNGITHSLNQLPAEYSLQFAAKRTVSTMGDILGFLERCRGMDEKEKKEEKEKNNINNNINNNNKKKGLYDDNYSTYEDNYDSTYNYENLPPKRRNLKKTRVPVGIALLQNLFADAINEKKFKQAARIIRLLEGSRLVNDLETPGGTSNSVNTKTAANSLNGDNESTVNIVRETLARRWAALLIGSSLNKLKSNVAGSLKLMAAMKYLHREEDEKEKEKVL